MLPICVIEDGAPIRKLVEVLLRKANYEVVSFEQGMEAVQWLQENPVQAVICDLILPDINGVEILRFVRGLPRGEDTPVIAVTGLAEEKDRDFYLASGFDAYITKPISTATFAEAVRQCIQQKERARRPENVG